MTGAELGWETPVLREPRGDPDPSCGIQEGFLEEVPAQPRPEDEREG